MEGRFVSYLRVSTDRQGDRGLGIDAQRKIVTDYLNGGDWTLGGEFVEVESGKHHRNRPELAKAMRQARLIGGTLLIAKLDRLARNVAFISALMESGVPFVACDMPKASSFELHIRAALAEEETRLISRRTKDALAAAKAKGTRLGGWRKTKKDGTPIDLGKTQAAAQAATKAFAASVTPIALPLRQSGMSYPKIAAQLSANGILTYQGKAAWTPMAVKLLLDRAGAAAA